MYVEYDTNTGKLIKVSNTVDDARETKSRKSHHGKDLTEIMELEAYLKMRKR